MTHQEFDSARFLDEFYQGIDTVEYDPKEIAAAQLLINECLGRGWSREEQDSLLVGIKLLLISVHGEKRDNGVDPTATHALEVAYITLTEFGGNAFDVTSAVIHDTPEDTQKRGTNVVTIEHIRTLFGDRMAQRIDGLTKVKSIKNQDLPVQTHHKIYEVFPDDPGIVKIKLADRLHSLRTLQFLTKEQQLRKAQESLDIYIPLAKSVGYHKIAREMTHRSIYYLLPKDRRYELDQYQLGKLKSDITHKKTIGNYLSSFRDIISAESGEVHISFPDLYDRYKASKGDLDLIFAQSILPTAMIVIPEGALYSSDVNANGTGKKRWRDKATLVALRLYEQGFFSDSQFIELRKEIARKGKEVQVTSLVGGDPIKIRFIDATYYEYRRANLGDFDNPEGSRHAFAVDKINRLQKNYRRIKNSKSAFNTAIEFSELLQGGAIVVSDADGKPYGLPEGATALDAAFAFKSKLLRFVDGVEIWRDDQKLSNPQLFEVLEHGDTLVFRESENHDVTIQPDWLDHVVISDVFLETQRYFRNRMRLERKRNLPLIERPITSQFRKRGIETLQDVFMQFPQKKIWERDGLFVDLLHAQHLFGQDKIKYPTEGKSSEQECTDFFIRVGMGEIRGDNTQTSLLWQVARHFHELQSSLQVYEVMVLNTAGALGQVLRTIGEDSHINIEHISPSRLNALPGYLTILLYIMPSDVDQFQKVVAGGLSSMLSKKQILQIQHVTDESLY